MEARKWAQVMCSSGGGKKLGTGHRVHFVELSKWAHVTDPRKEAMKWLNYDMIFWGYGGKKMGQGPYVWKLISHQRIVRRKKENQFSYW